MPTPAISRLRTVSSLVLRLIIGGVVMTAVALASVILVLAVRPTDNVKVLSVKVGVGASSPDLSLCGTGQLINYGVTNNIRAIHVCGPVRPVIETHATAQEIAASANITDIQGKAGHEIASAFTIWAIERSIAVVAVGSILAFLVWRLFPHSWRKRVTGSFFRTGLIALCFLVTLTLVWGSSLYSAYAGSRDLKNIQSISDLFDYTKLRTAPEPVGPKVPGYQLAVIGDSRASLWGGKPLPAPTANDKACSRSRDSLAAQLEQLDGDPNVHAINLACPNATIAYGLLGPQDRNGRELPAQVGLLKQLVDLKQVVVMIGPNDVNWSFLMGTCLYIGCDSPLTGNSVSAELASFRTPYNDLLGELHNLPSHPAVTIVGSYGLYAANADCPDTKSYFGDHDITSGDIDLINQSRDQLNDVLQSGAEKMKFAYLTPHLLPLCAPDLTGMGPQIQGVGSNYRFHPTPVGEAVLGAQIYARLEPPPPAPKPSTTPQGTTAPAAGNIAAAAPAPSSGSG